MLLLDKLRTQTENATAKFIWLGSDGKEEETLTGVEIYQRAGAVANMLVAAKLKPGDRAMIAYPPGLDFLAALIGCARAGVICCSVYPPDPSKLKKSFAHFCTFAKDAGTVYVLTTSTMKKIMQGATLLHGPKIGLKYIVTDGIKKATAAKPFNDFQATESDPCFIQYSSGSTGNPKGVVISHGALANNLEFMRRTHNLQSKTSAVCWLPQYHDYGLVANYFAALVYGFNIVCLSPITFIRNPLIWTSVIEKHKCTITCGPNFSFALVHRKWTEAGKPAMNLSSLENVSIAAEPINPDTIDKMIEIGIPPRAIRPSYGLAENVVFVNTTPRGPPTVHEGRVACCVVMDGEKRIITNTDGEIYIQGDDLASGYWNRPELAQETFHNILPGLDGEWLRTGDLGFIHDGLLFVTGRKKELIKVRGKNYFPTDIEIDVEKEFEEFLRPGCSAAFQHTEASVGYVAEVRDEKKMPDTAKITQHILAEHGVQCTYIKLMPKGSLPKTTSGKIKRVQVQADAQSSTTSTSSSGLDASSFIQALDGTGNSTLDLDKTLAENGADSMTQVEIENKLGSSRVLTEHHRTILRSGRSLRDIAQELADSPNRPRNIELKSSPIRKARTIHISTTVRGLGMCLINLINLAIPLTIAGAVYEISVSWGGILVWAAMHTACVALCLRLLTFGGTDSFEVGCNTTAYLRWYFCRNMLAIWNAFIGTWLAGTLPYFVFLRCIGAHIHPTAVVDHLFEYVDARLKIGPNARVEGICDTAAHVNADKMRFGPVTIGANANVRGNSRMWPGAELGDNSSLDYWCRLEFDEHVGNSMAVTGSPAVGDPSTEQAASTSILWINISRIIIIPSLVVSSFYVASFVAVSDPFFQYCTTFLLSLLILVFAAPLVKIIAIDVLKGGAKLAETTDQIGTIASNAVLLFFYAAGGPIWNLYMRMYGTRIELDTITPNATVGTPSQAGRLTIKNSSFISAFVRLRGSGPAVIDNSECAFGSVVPADGISEKQLLRHGVTRARVPKKYDLRRSLLAELVISILLSWLYAGAFIMSIYPLYRAGAELRPLIASRAAFVPAVFVPAVTIQTLCVWPAVLRAVTLALHKVPEERWFMAAYMIRVWGSATFFAGSPLNNIALNIQGARVAANVRFFGGIRDDHRVTVTADVVVDSYSRAAAHLYHQREFIKYQTKLSPNTLYDGGLYVGDPAKFH